MVNVISKRYKPQTTQCWKYCALLHKFATHIATFFNDYFSRLCTEMSAEIDVAVAEMVRDRRQGSRPQTGFATVDRVRDR